MPSPEQQQPRPQLISEKDHRLEARTKLEQRYSEREIFGSRLYRLMCSLKKELGAEPSSVSYRDTYVMKEFRKEREKLTRLPSHLRAYQNLIPEGFIPVLQTLEAFVHYPEDEKEFAKTVSEDIFANRLEEQVDVAFFVARAEYMRDIFLPELEQRARTLIETHRAPLLEHLASYLNPSPTELARLQTRLDRIKVQAIDPLLGTMDNSGGYYDALSKTVSISTVEDMLHLVIHEFLHALSTQTVMRVEDDGDWQDELAEDAVEQSYSEEYLEETDLALYEPTRVGVRVLSRFRFLNEGVTEFLAARYLVDVTEPPLSHRVEVAPEDRPGFVNPWGTTSYKAEVYLLMNLPEPWEIYLSNWPELMDRLDQAKDRYAASGGMMDGMEMNTMLFRAHLFDHTDGTTSERATYWRAWSAKMRELYGDGVLVELDQTWNQHAGRNASTAESKDAGDACLQLLVKRFVQTWDKA